MDRQQAPWDTGGVGPIRRRSSTYTTHRDTRPRLSILRGMPRAASLTAVAADDAIQRFLYLQCLARVAHVRAPNAPHSPPSAVAPPAWTVTWPAAPENPWIVRGVLIGVLVVVVVTLAATCLPTHVPVHSVDGVVFVGRQPLMQGRIVFHPTQATPDRGPLGYQTGRDGSFRSAAERGIPDGLYVIVVESGSVGAARAGVNGGIPPIYRDVATTPLRVHVTENLSGLRLMIRK